ncbi:MAG: histidine phosphatase family protein [Rhodoferax sp.]|uniref:histidine phosphatase family protein n=1 Tax=Rhodoferax sp. TaxID=50421 RepID=UPI0026237688|nr:histidine phosphatase family protein [Rhodoferax sp.]MDD2881422.1 histidine phosphatase family protein [Rhodoferax sp.]
MIWLVRHAQPLIAPGICYGALDVAADPDATRVAAQALAECLPKNAMVVSSPLQRCELLAHTLYELRPDLSYKTDARLAEMNFGEFEGKRWDSISAQAYDNWTADFWQHRFGGVESVAEFMARVALVWDEALSAGTEKLQVWVTHAGVIRAASLISKGVRVVCDAKQWPADAPAFGEVWCIKPTTAAS